MRAGAPVTLAALALALATGTVRAEAPATSPRPILSPLAVLAAPEAGAAASAGPTAQAAALAQRPAPETPRPLARPPLLATAEAAEAEPAPAPTPLPGAVLALGPGSSAAAPLAGLRPAAKPVPKPAGGALTRVALSGASAPANVGKPGQRGLICGTPGLTGTAIPAIPSRVKGCGLEDGVKITHVSGIPLSMPATIDCPTAQALKTWVDRGIVPAVGSRGGGVKQLMIAGSYTCRPRNNQAGAKVSEHGRGRAIDLAGIKLANGQVITVAKDWGREGKILKAVHKSACGPFGTVLGPKSDRFHDDHIHVDTARYRSGTYCK